MFVLTGLPLTTLFAIFGAVGAAVLVLYILKLRRRVVAVPFSPLWQRILRDKEATSLFSKLKRLLSLLLQLALLAILVLALGQPKLSESLLKSRRIVVLIDASASMQAIDEDPTRLDAAKKKLREMVRGLNGAEKMLIAQMDAMVTPLGPMTDDIAELEKMIDQVRPTETRADFPRALRFALDALRDAKKFKEEKSKDEDDDDEEAEIVVLSDGKLGDLRVDTSHEGELSTVEDSSGKVQLPLALEKDGKPKTTTKKDKDGQEILVPVHKPKLSFLQFGKSNVNCALTQFSVRRYPLDKARYEVMLEVKNTTPFEPSPELAAMRAALRPIADQILEIGKEIDKEKDNEKKKALGQRREELRTKDYEARTDEAGRREFAEKDKQVLDVELSLFGDGQIVDVTMLRVKPGEALARFYPNLSGASRTLEAKIRTIVDPERPDHVDMLPVDNRAYALLPERRRAKVLVVTEGNTYLEAALLLDEYLDVSDVKPIGYARKVAAEKFDLVIFDGATPAELPNTHAFYINPRGPGSPVKSSDDLLKQPGFDSDKIARKHPVIRYTALDDVNIAVGHKLTPEQGDKALGSFGDKAILVAGSRKGNKFVALGFDLRDSDLPLRMAWPLLLINSINWFMDEDANYLSSFRTGDVWRVPVGSGARSASLKLPNGETQTLPVHEGRAVYLGEHAGFYELTVDPGDPGAAPLPTDAQVKPDPSATPGVTAFAANLLDDEESTIGPVPMDKFIVNGADAGEFTGSSQGVRREFWIYLLLAAAIVTAIEWATYHRRLTV